MLAINEIIFNVMRYSLLNLFDSIVFDQRGFSKVWCKSFMSDEWEWLILVSVFFFAVAVQDPSDNCPPFPPS